MLSAACTNEASLGGVEQNPIASGGSSGAAGSDAGVDGEAGAPVPCELSVYDVTGQWFGHTHKSGAAMIWFKDDGVTFYQEIRAAGAAGCERVDALHGTFGVSVDRISVRVHSGDYRVEKCDDPGMNHDALALSAAEVENYQTLDWDRSLYTTSDGVLMRGTGFLRDEGCPPQLFGTWRGEETERDGRAVRFVHRWQSDGGYFESTTTEYPTDYFEVPLRGCVNVYEASGSHSDLGEQRFLATYQAEFTERTGCLDLTQNSERKALTGARPEQEFYYDMDRVRLFLYGDVWVR